VHSFFPSPFIAKLFVMCVVVSICFLMALTITDLVAVYYIRPPTFRDKKWMYIADGLMFAGMFFAAAHIFLATTLFAALSIAAGVRWLCSVRPNPTDLSDEHEMQ